MSESEKPKKELDQRMENILRTSSSYFNLAALLTGLTISAIFIYIIRPGDNELNPFNSVVIFFLTITMIFFIAGTIFLSFIYERVSKLKVNSEIDNELLKKKVHFNELETDFARKCTIGGLIMMLATTFYLISTLDIYLGGFTVICAIGLFFILGILRYKNFKQAGLFEEKKERKVKINVKRLVIIFLLLILSSLLPLIIENFF